MTAESQIEGAVCRHAQRIGMSSHKWKGVNEKGLPDRIFIIPGPIAHWFAVEFKKPGGVLSPSQKRKIKKFRSMGVHVYTCCTIDMGVSILNTQKREHLKRVKILQEALVNKHG